ncbi:DUF2892 domain-containing protein [Aquidulcibacter sp.]|jgi:hypothetical protein|uniref:DUF2892 domain-containing protein n=1 Tax=Aquidulcibacter sp. TaxID=2052990 RepID=UPI0037C04AE1
MIKNMGNLDRIIRLTIVLAIGVAFALGKISGVLALLLGVVGLAFLLTSLVGTCPIYLPFGLSTRLKKTS